MIGKKMLSWIGAGLLSAAIAIPTIGATVAHKKLVKHHAVHRTHTTAHRKATKAVAHKKVVAKGKTSAKKTVLATHAVNRAHVTHLTHSVHKKAAVHKTQAVRASYGVTSMHSGKTSVAKAAPAADKKAVTLAKSTSTKSKAASQGTLLSASTTVKTQK